MIASCIEKSLAAISLALLVWLYARSRDQEILDNVVIPVQVSLVGNQAEMYSLEPNGPAEVLATFTGSPSRIRDVRGLVQRKELVAQGGLHGARRTPAHGLATPIPYWSTSATLHAPSGVTVTMVESRQPRARVTVRAAGPAGKRRRPRPLEVARGAGRAVPVVDLAWPGGSAGDVHRAACPHPRTAQSTGSEDLASRGRAGRSTCRTASGRPVCRHATGPAARPADAGGRGARPLAEDAIGSPSRSTRSSRRSLPVHLDGAAEEVGGFLACCWSRQR